MKRVLSSLLVILFLFSLPGSAGAFTYSASNTDNQRVIVVFDQQVDKQIKQIITMAGGKIGREYNNSRACAATVSVAGIKALRSNHHVVAVEPDIIITIDSQNPDWGIAAANAPAAWSSGLTGEGIKVAVVDTGVASHLDLVIAGGVSFASYTSSYKDDNGHGTHVAGIIGAQNNYEGTVGIAPDASLYAVKVLDKYGSGYLSDIIAGIDWSIDNKMDIVNLSLGTTFDSLAFKQEVEKAYAAGVLVVAAAGNSGTAAGTTDTVNYPAKYDSVIAVAAIDSSNKRASWSSTGNKVEVAAPGVNVRSTYLNNTYVTMSGTSMATPYVAGDLALLKEQYPDLTNVQLRSKLQEPENLVDLGDPGRDTWYGFGLIQAPIAGSFDPLAPVATDDTYVTEEDTKLEITALQGVLANDTNELEGSGLTAKLVNNVAHGTLIFNTDGSFSYTPVANFNGEDNFTYKAYNGTGYSAAAIVTIAVNAVNDAPTAVNDTYSTIVNTPLAVNIPGVLSNDTDPDSSKFTAGLVETVSDGASLTLNTDGSFSYTPALNFIGSDSFTYRANDGELDSNIATVTITVNEAPAAATQTKVTTSKSTYSIGHTAYIYVVVSDASGKAIQGATVQTTVTNPSGSKVTYKGTTDRYGKLTVRYSIPSRRSAMGLYKVLVNTTYLAYAASSASATFSAR